MEAIHILRGGVAPDDGWLASMGRRLCQGCRRLMARSSSHCQGCRRQGQEDLSGSAGPLGPGTPLSQPEPPMRPTISAVLGDRRGVLEHVPRGCRASVLQALGRVLHNFCTMKTWESLRDLLGFGKAILAAPKRGGHRRLPALEREVILRANALGTSSFEDLWARTAVPAKASKPKSRVPRSETIAPPQAHQAIPEDVVSRVSALVGEGALSKACKVLLSTGVWDPEDPRVSRKLQDLHPVTGQPDLSTQALGTDLDSLPRFHWDMTAKGKAERLQALQSTIGHFPPGSAGGPSGLRPAHLKDCLCEADASSQAGFLSALDDFVRLCLDGDLPQAASPYLCAAHLVPLRKTEPTVPEDPQAPVDVRPVAVGEVLRRLVSKVCMAQGQMRRAAVDMEPVQCGLGTRGACELIGQATTTLVRELHLRHAEQNDWAVLQVDLANAFNCVSRQHMMQAFVDRCPEAAHWMASSYGQPAHLFCGSLRLLSHTGVQQGDNMGPAGFCFATQDLW